MGTDRIADGAVTTDKLADGKSYPIQQDCALYSPDGQYSLFNPQQLNNATGYLLLIVPKLINTEITETNTKCEIKCSVFKNVQYSTFVTLDYNLNPIGFYTYNDETFPFKYTSKGLILDCIDIRDFNNSIRYIAILCTAHTPVYIKAELEWTTT